MNRDHSVIFEIASRYCISDSLVDHDGHSISSEGFLPTVVDIMVIWVKFTHSSAFSWQNSISLFPASFCIPRPYLPVTPGVSWLPTFVFQSPIMKRASFWLLVLEGLVGLHRTIQLQLLQHYWSGHLLLGRKVMANLDSIFKSRDITLPTKVRLVKAMVFPVVMYGCESWTIKKTEHWRIAASELCFGEDSWESLGLQEVPTSPS